jgi:hypothetical protein
MSFVPPHHLPAISVNNTENTELNGIKVLRCLIPVFRVAVLECTLPKIVSLHTLWNTNIGILLKHSFNHVKFFIRK